MSDGNRLSIREITELALWCALMVAGKELMRALPNVHPVTLFLSLCVIVYGWKALLPVFGFVVIEIALYGLGLWTIMYIYIWPIYVFAAMPFRGFRSRGFWALLAGLHGVCFGALCAIPYLFLGGFKTAAAWWVSGFPYDLLHGTSNAVIVFLLLPVLLKTIGKIKKRY